MRRHVEISKKDKLAVISFILFWLIALTALSASAHGRDRGLNSTSSTTQANALGTTVPENKAPAIDQPASLATASGDGHANGAKAANSANDVNSGTNADEDDSETLTRFILISIPDRQLALVDNGEVVKVYPIAVGKDATPSPTGEFTIISHAVNPTYSHEGKVVPPGPDNPVGTRWMGLSLKGYGIHGTNVQSSIGKAASHGCFRMKKKDVEELFKLVKVGDTVIIRGERDELTEEVFGTTDTRATETRAVANDNSTTPAAPAAPVATVAAAATVAGGQE